MSGVPETAAAGATGGGAVTAPLRVVKIGGRVQGQEALAAVLAAAWRRTPGALVVVHGGGDEVTALQRRLGTEPTFVGGRRVTREEDVELLRMALSGVANKRLVSALVREGVEAVGISGEDAGLLLAEPGDLAALGRVGRVRRVNVRFLWDLLDGGFFPVVSPLAAAHDGSGALNVNGDDAAAAVAAALDADELLLVADVPGVLVGGEPAPTLDATSARAAVASGEASGGMAAKLDAALAALAHGVPQVRIGDLAAIDDATRGTVVTTTSRSTR